MAMSSTATLVDLPLFPHILSLTSLATRVSWPHTLVLSPSQLSHYQLVFKLLLVLKLTERQLSLTWHRVAGAVRSRDKALVSARFPKRSVAAAGPGASAGGAAAAAAGQAAPAQGLGLGAGAVAFPWDETELQLVYSLGQRFTFFVQVRGAYTQRWRAGLGRNSGGGEGAGERGKEVRCDVGPWLQQLLTLSQRTPHP